ncbi:glycosyltransferase family 39 protein [Pseudomonas fluorescens]|uniref:glycosyltransferase family 39 protein n=1 Tax=Pseudomonas fluorescens TaxID=294 RepID=UPI003F9BD058
MNAGTGEAGVVMIERWTLHRMGVIGLVGLALLARFHGITEPVIWYDEGFSLLLSQRSPALIWTTTAGDVHPPLYYVVLHYWTALLGRSVLSVRSLSALADVGTLLLCIKLMSLLVSRRAALIAGVLFALLPLAVRYSQEVRMYTLLGLWLMAATVVLVCWGRQPYSRRYPLLYVLLMAAAFYTHYFAALCVLVHWLYWSGLGSGEPVLLPVRRWLLVNVAIVLLYMPWLPNFVEQARTMKGLEWIPPMTWQTLPDFIGQSTVMTTPAEGGWWGGLIVSALMIVCAVRVLTDRRIDRRSALLLVAYFFVPVVVVFLLSWAVPIFIPRYLVFAAVGLPMLVAITLDRIAARWPIAALLCLCLFAAAQWSGLQRVYAQQDGLNGTLPRKLVRLDSIAEGIRREFQAGDEIVIDGLFWYLPFSYYNDTGIQPRLYVSRLPSGKPSGPLAYGGWLVIPQRLDWIFFSDVSALEPVAKRVWWVAHKNPGIYTVTFPKGWKQMQTIDGGDIEARLFIPNAER